MDWYGEPVENESKSVWPPDDEATEYVERRQAELDLLVQLQDNMYNGPAINIIQCNNPSLSNIFNSIRRQSVERRWECLHDKSKHFKLREAIMDQLMLNRSN